MTVTQSALLADVRSRLDEATANQWTDTEIRRWINQAATEVARRTETLQATQTISMVAGQQQYTAPVDAIRIYRIEYLGANSSVSVLEYRDYNNADSVWWSSQLTNQSDPKIWTAWGFPPSLKLVLYPLPPSSSYSIKVFYYRLPTKLAESTTADANTAIDIPDGWQDLIVDYAEYCALRKDRDPRWQEAKSLFDQGVQNMMDLTRRWTDQAGMIDTDNGAGPLHPFIWNEDW